MWWSRKRKICFIQFPRWTAPSFKIAPRGRRKDWGRWGMGIEIFRVFRRLWKHFADGNTFFYFFCGGMRYLLSFYVAGGRNNYYYYALHGVSMWKYTSPEGSSRSGEWGGGVGEQVTCDQFTETLMWKLIKSCYLQPLIQIFQNVPEDWR